MRRILVVDDDRSMVRTLCDIFRLRGWHPDGVYSGEEAIAAEVTGNYCAVLMDIRMPGMDGVATFKAMRAGSRMVPVVLMTAHSDRATVLDAENAGARCVLSKPIDLVSLMGVMDSLGCEH